MIQFFARVVELREEKHVKYDGKITMDSPSREFLEVTNNLRSEHLINDPGLHLGQLGHTGVIV